MLSRRWRRVGKCQPDKVTNVRPRITAWAQNSVMIVKQEEGGGDMATRTIGSVETKVGASTGFITSAETKVNDFYVWMAAAIAVFAFVAFAPTYTKTL